MSFKRIKPTWIIHGVGDENTPISYYTCGLKKYGSLELEINLPIKEDLAMHIINSIGFMIMDGKRFNDGDIINEGTIAGCKLVMRNDVGIYSEERVIRIIIPDEKLRFPWDKGCSDFFRDQIKVTNDNLN